MKKIKLKDLVILIFYCICILFSAVILGFLIASILNYFKVGVFNFNPSEALLTALKKGSAGGSVLGLGIWIKGKLRERQGKKNCGGE